MATKLSFTEQIKNPKWQKKRLEVMEAAGFECENCGDKETTLNVHHKQYVKGRMYWEYERHELECLCEVCHKSEHDAQDGLKALLAEVDTTQAFSVLAGFHHHSDWVDPANVLSARQGDALNYAAGFIGWLASNLSIDEMDQLANYATTLMRPNAEARLVYGTSRRIFGIDD